MDDRGINFIKMHGLGNDFIIIDARKRKVSLSAKQLKNLANRQFGIGCDQLVVMEKSNKADVMMRIYNSDGGEVSSCGNASRCVAWLIFKEKQVSKPASRERAKHRSNKNLGKFLGNIPQGKKNIFIETEAGLLSCIVKSKDIVTVDMGKAYLNWDKIPLSKKLDTNKLPISEGPLKNPSAVSMGNPHMVFFVGDTEKIDLSKLGPKLEHHPLFPKRTNVEVAEVISKKHLKVRVWERGAGETLACGTGACAVAVVASRHKLTDKKVKISLKGGDLFIEIAKNGHVLMTGPVSTSFSGNFLLKDYG